MNSHSGTHLRICALKSLLQERLSIPASTRRVRSTFPDSESARQERLVHAPCPVPGEIHRHIRKSILFQGSYDREPIFEKHWKIFRKNFDPRHHSMDPDPELRKAKIEQELLRSVDHRKLLYGDRLPVHKSGCKTCVTRFVPRGKPEVSGQGPDVALCKSACTKRAFYPQLGDSRKPRPVISKVIKI